MLKLNVQYLATWFEERTHLKRLWCWEWLNADDRGDDRGWDVWMPSLTRWTWVWVSFGIWWCTVTSVLQSMGSRRVGHDWVTELSWPGAVMALGGVSFHLLIKDQNLVLSVISVPSDSNRFILCAWPMSFFQKLCPAPFPPVTFPAQRFYSYILMESRRAIFCNCFQAE